MFNVGGPEILVIILVALIVLGPQRLPGAVRQAGQFMGELRKLSSGFQAELKGAFDEVEKAEAKPAQVKPVSGTMATPAAVTDPVDAVTDSTVVGESTEPDVPASTAAPAEPVEPSAARTGTEEPGDPEPVE